MRRAGRLSTWAIFLIVWTSMCLIPVVAAVLFAAANTPGPDRCGEGCGMVWVVPSFVIYATVPIWIVVATAGVWLSRRRLPPSDDGDQPPRRS